MGCRMSELWLPVPGYEGFYEVSDQGRVRSVDRVIQTRKGPSRRKGRVRRPHVHKQGYLELPLCRDGEQQMFTVHRLVMLAFVGPRPEGMDICHGDGDKRNNSVSNLRYDTHTENQLDIVRQGRHQLANKTHCIHGHPFDAENTRWVGRARVCRTCNIRNCAEWRKARAESFA